MAKPREIARSVCPTASQHTIRFRPTLALNGNNLFAKFHLNTSNKLGRGREFSTTYTVSF